MERNLTLDNFKIFLCILVISSHFQPLFNVNGEDVIGWIISNGVSRIAVPCFFIINGYFLSGKIENAGASKKYLWKTLTIYISWTIIYLGYFISRADYLVAGYLFMGYYHLWYLAALTGVVIIFLFHEKMDKK